MLQVWVGMAEWLAGQQQNSQVKQARPSMINMMVGDQDPGPRSREQRSLHFQ